MEDTWDYLKTENAVPKFESYIRGWMKQIQDLLLESEQLRLETDDAGPQVFFIKTITYFLLYKNSQELQEYLKFDVQWCANQTGHGLFFTVNGHFQKGDALTKCDVKSTIFLSICFTNVETFSTSFGYDIFILSETAQQSIYFT